jgi:tetratricopeptide (TPR) repeat protein
LGFKEGELQDARTALGSAEAQLALTKDSWTKQLSSANIVFAIAEYYEFNGDFAEARLRFKDASDRFRRLVKGEKLATYSQYLIQALTKQASQEYELGHAAALDTINEAIQFADDVIEVQTAYQRENQYRRIEAYLIRSRINFRNGWLPATEDDINVAKSESQKLFGEFPKYHHFKLQYARILRMEARVARSQDQTQESLNLLSEAMTIIRTKENNFIWESELVRTARLQARIFLVDGKTDMAEESLKLAISKEEGIYAAYSVPTEATVLQELKDLLSKVEATRSNDE